MKCLTYVNSELKEKFKIYLVSRIASDYSGANAKSFDVNSFTKDLYKWLTEQPKTLPTSLDLTRIIPTLLLESMRLNTDFSKMLTVNNPNVKMEITALEQEFDKNLNTVRDFLGLNENFGVKLQNLQTKVNDMNQKDLEINADETPTTVFATYGDERDMKPHNIAVQRNINKTLLEQIAQKGIADSGQMEYPGVIGGIYGTILTAKEAKKKDPGTFKDENTSYYDNDNTKLLMMVLTDNTGMPIKFNDNGEVQKNGKIAYFKINDIPPGLEKGNKIITDKKEFTDYLKNITNSNLKGVLTTIFNNTNKLINSITDFYKKFLPKELAKEKAIDLVTKQFIDIKRMSVNLYNPAASGVNSYTTVLTGSKGFVEHNVWKKTALSAISFEGPIQFEIPQKENVSSIYKQGSLLFSYPGVGKQVVNGCSFFEKMNIVNNIILPLFTKQIYTESAGETIPLSIAERSRLIEQYLYTNDIKFLPVSQTADTWVDKKGKYTIIVNGESYKIDFENTPESIETRKKLADNIKAALLQPRVKSKINDDGKLVPEHIYSESDIKQAQIQGAHMVTNLKDATPESIYQEQVLDDNKKPIPNEFNYYQVFFPVINSKASVVLSGKIDAVSITNKENKNILTTVSQDFSEFAKNNFVTSAVPDKNGVLSQKSPKISFKPTLATATILNTKQKTKASNNIHELFKGKVVFSTTGSGKTEFAQTNSNVVDGDVLIVNAIKQVYGDKFTSSNTDPREIIKDFWDSKLPIYPVYELAKTESKRLAHEEGKTVLTGSLHIAPIADIALHQINPAHIREGYENMSKERKVITDLNNRNKFEGKEQIPVFEISKNIKDVITKSPEEIKADTKEFLKPEIKPTTEEKIEEKIKPLTQKLTPEEKLAETIKKLKEQQSKNKLQKSAVTKLENVRSTDEQIADGEKWYNETAKELSKHFPYKVMFNAVNTGYGPAAEWAVHGIILHSYYNAEGKLDKSRSGDFTDLYHEAWHGFSQTFLTPEERTSLYSEVAKRQGSFRDYNGNYVRFEDASPLQLEEFLAEDFRTYMMAGGKAEKGAPVKNGIFRKIMNFLKALFGKVATEDVIKNPKGYDKVNQIYEKLKIGDLSNYNFNVNNIDKTIGSLYQSLQALNPKASLQQLDIEDSTKLVNAINSIISEIITEVGPESLKTNNGKQIIYDHVKERFADAIDNLQEKLHITEDVDKKNTYQQSINTLQWAIDEFGDINTKEKGLLAYYIEKTKFLSEEEKEDFFGEKDLDEDYQTSAGTESDFAKLGNTLSQMQHGGELMNQMMRGIHKYDEDKQPILDSFGIHELADYHQVWNTLGRLLEGSLTKLELNEKLIANSANNPMVAEVLKKLGTLEVTMNDSADRLWSKFWSTFNLAKIKLEQMTVHEENGVFKTHIGSAHTQSSKVGALWKNGFSQMPLTEDGFIKVNRDIEDTDNGMRRYLDVAHTIKAFTDPNVKGKFNGDKLGFFKAMGIKFSTELGDVKKDIKDQINNKDIGSATILFNKLRTLYNQRGIEKLYNLNDIFREYSEDINKGYDAISSNEGDFSELAQLETKNSDYAPNDMVTTAKGTTQFEKSLNNTISVIATTLNNVKSYAELMDLTYMRYLNIETNPNAASSILLNSIFDLSNYKKGDPNFNGPKRKQKTENGSSDVKVNMTNLSGVVMLNENGGVGEALAQVDEYTKLIADVHLNIEGMHPELMRHADKGTSFSFWVSKVIAEDQKARQYIANEDFIEANIQNVKTIPAYQKMHKIMFDYLNAELQRKTKLKDLSKRLKAGERIQYDTAYLKKGQNFVVFKGILEPDTLSKLENFTSIADINKDKKLVADIETQLNKYFEWNTERVSKKLNKAKYVDKAIIGKIRTILKSKGVTDKAVTNAVIEKGIVRSFVVNNWIHNLETINMIYGDLALYKDFHKRNAGAGSTGNLIATDKVSIDRVNASGRLYERSLNLNKPEKVLNSDGSVDSSIFSDNNPTSVYHDIILKQYEEDNYAKLNAFTTAQKAKVKSQVEAKAKKEAEKYEKIEEEGNAQGWSTFDFYKILCNLIGKWTPIQQKMYQDIIDKKKIDPKKVIETFPVLKLQYWGQLKVAEGMLPLIGFHKFSVLPLIPGVIAKEGDPTDAKSKGNNLHELHMKMMSQDIDYALFKSGSKISTVTNLDEDGKAIPDKFYKGKDEEHIFDKDSTMVKNTTFLQFMKDQLDIAPYYKENVTFPTQMRKLIEIGLMADETPTDYSGGKKLWNSLDETEKRNISKNYNKLKTYENYITTYSEKLKAKFEKEGDIKYENGKVKITPKLLKFLTKQLDTQDLGEHEIAFIKKNNKGELAHDLSISLTAEKFEKGFNSLIVRKLVKQKFLGEGLVQTAGTGWESSRTGPLSLYERLHHGTNGLEFYRPERFDDIIDSDKDFATFYFGNKEGEKQTDKANLDLHNNIIDNPDSPMVDSGESFNEAVRRIIPNIDRIVKTADDNTVVVTHNSVFGLIYLWDKAGRPENFDEKELRKKYVDQDNKFNTGAHFEIKTDKGVIHIVRHGETEDNWKNLFRTSFTQLTKKGIKQAEEVGEKLKDKKIPLVISSSLDRAIHTSQLILSKNKNRLEEVKIGNTKAMKVKIALQADYVKLLDAVHNDGKTINTLDRLNDMLKSERWLNTNNHRKMISLIGPRIPVQGLNSQEFAEVYEFLDPRAGNIIVLPSEIVVKAGGDYDIDKLTMMFPHISSGINWKTWGEKEGLDKLKTLSNENPDLEFNLSPENVKKVIEERKQDERSDEDKKLIKFLADNSKKNIAYISNESEEGLQNNIIDSMKSILAGKNNFTDLTRPNDTNILKPIAEDLAKDVMEYDPNEGLYNNGESFEDTRVLEILHNLYVHTSNNIGKQVLGIAAKVNTYHALLTRVGAYLNYDYTIGNGNNAFTKSINLLLDHNSTINEKGQKVISLAGIYDKELNNKISDVISQIMNGAVDVAKDAWLFNIQGNKESIPVLLFMTLAGVPAKQAIYLASNPLVREYTNQQRLAKSIFAKPLGNAPEDPSFYRSHARKKILTEFKYGINAKETPIKNTNSTYIRNEDRQKVTDEFTSPERTNIFTGTAQEKENALRKTVRKFNSNSDYTDSDRAAFLHFIDIEDLSKSITALTSNSDIDTSRSKSTFEAEAKLEGMENLRDNPIIPEWVITKLIGKPNEDPTKSIKGESPIASFNIQNFQVKFLEPLFKLINNSRFNTFLLAIKNTQEFKNDVKKAGGDTEKYINKLRFGIISFIFHNYLRRNIKNIDNLTSYNGVDVDTKYNIVKVSSLNQGIFAQKNAEGNTVFYLNKKRLKNSFKLLKQNPEKNLTGINLNTTVFNNDSNSYYSFMFEKELLRSQFSGVEGWQKLQQRNDVQKNLKEAKVLIKKEDSESEKEYDDRINTIVYENTLKSMALDNTYNMYKMFKSEESMADELTKIQFDYPELAKNYSVLNNIVADTFTENKNNKRINNIILTDTMLDGDNINLYHQNLKDLSSPQKIKLTATTEEKARICDYFNRLVLFSFFQAGMNTKGKFSLIRLMPQEQFTKLMTIYGPDFLSKSSSENNLLTKYYNKFSQINRQGRLKTRFADWQIKDFNTEIDFKDNQGIEFEKDNKDNNIYNTTITKTNNKGEEITRAMTVNEARTLLSVKSENVFATNGLMGGVISNIKIGDNALNAVADEDGFGNVISIPVKDRNGNDIKDESSVVKNIQGIDISSNTKGLGGALTNPTSLAKNKRKITREYPVELQGKIYKDAETAYQALKETATKDEGPNSTYNLMVQIIKAKLEQHPVLTEKITEQGGTQFILKSTHQPTTKNTVWETGGKNWFIKALNEAYLSIVPIEEPNNLGIQPLVKTQIDNAIAALIAQNSERGTIVFPKTGFGLNLIGAVNNVLKKDAIMQGIKTFTYLSQRLYDEFQYVNPYFEYVLAKQDLENYVQKNQPVSDVDVNKARNINKPEGLPGIGRTSKTCE